jgi:hypothetical protein
MLSNKWKASYDINLSTVANGKKHLYGPGTPLMDRRQLIVNRAIAAFYQELASSQIMTNRRKNKRRTPLQSQT